MQRWTRSLLVPLLIVLTAAPGFAAVAGPPTVITQPIARPTLLLKPPVPVAFSPVPNRYSDVDPATSFDLNGDLVGDLKVTSTTVTAQNGAQVQLLDPAVLSLDEVQGVPAAGYTATAPLQLSRVYVMQLPGGGYAKFLLLQASPKVTIWFGYGTPTTSQLRANGAGGNAVLTWDALADAQLGYNVYRYEFMDNNSYTVILLNDFTVQGTTFTDNTVQNHYYLYVVMAIKSGGLYGNTTTTAAVQIQSVLHSIVLLLTPGTGSLDGGNIPLSAKPVIKNGRLMVPATLLASAGVKVTTDTVTGHITLARKLDNVTYTLGMTVDAPEYTWNGTSYKADVPPYMAGSEAMVPMRVVAPALGFGLLFNSTDRSAKMEWSE